MNPSAGSGSSDGSWPDPAQPGQPAAAPGQPPFGGPPFGGPPSEFPPAGYPVPQPPKRNNTLKVIGFVAFVIVLICGAGIAFVALTADSSDPTDADVAASSSVESVEGDLDKFKTGDCLTIKDPNNTVKSAKCTDAGAYKVLLRKDGTADDEVCADTEATTSLSQDDTGTKNDFVLCVGPVA